MTIRKVTDEDGRQWECKGDDGTVAPGRDVSLVCTTSGLKGSFQVKVSWQWLKMAERGLARMIAAAAPPIPAK